MAKYAPGTKSLAQFKSFIPQQVFKNAENYPDFFKTHLVDPSRVIKIFKDDPNAVQRIFYYQYLKLCEETAEGYPQIRADNMRQLLNSPQFNFMFPADSQQFPYTDDQFKRLALQILEAIQQSKMKAEDAIRNYPIIDLVFTYLMRTLLLINQQAEDCQQFIQKDRVLSVLGKIFDVQMQNVGNCTRFAESDVFVYEESPFQLYMVYLQQQPLKKQPEPNIISAAAKRANKKQKSLMYKSNTSNNEAYDFVDYTDLKLTKVNNNSLFQSENLSLRSHFKPHQRQHSRKQPSKKSSNNSAALEVDQVEQKFQNEQECAMQIKVIQPIKVIENQGKQQERKQSIQKFDPQSQYSDLESNDNQPKIQVMLPTSTTLTKNANNPQKDIIWSKTSIQKPIEQITQVESKQKAVSSQLLPTKMPIQKYASPAFSDNYQSRQKCNSIKIETTFESRTVNPNLYSFKQQSTKHYIPSSASYLAQDFKDIGYTVKKSIPAYKDNSSYLSTQHSKIQKFSGYFPVVSLNVTKEFTNSFVMKEMPEAYRENVRRARERARAFRRTLLQIF